MRRRSARGLNFDRVSHNRTEHVVVYATSRYATLCSVLFCCVLLCCFRSTPCLRGDQHSQLGMNNDSQRGASSAAPSWARLACRDATTMAVLLFNYVREHTRRSPLSQRVLVKQMGFPTSNCIALPMLDLSLWAAAGQALLPRAASLAQRCAFSMSSTSAPS